MKKYLIGILLLLPLVSSAQLAAVNPDVVKPTRQLTGRAESVYVFFDKTTGVLNAQSPGGTATTFTWRFLNPADTTFTIRQTDANVVSSTYTVTAPGGYQVALNNAALDTFSCWVFFDNFHIDTITALNTCTELRLDEVSTPSIYTGYTIYNFNQFLNPPHIGDSTYYGVQSMQWSASADIHEGVDNPDISWKTRKSSYIFISSPPPLKESSYSLNVIDVFGKSASYTTSYTVPAIAVYAKITAQEFVDNQWKVAPEPPKGDALYQLRFSQEESINAGKFYWKGFGNENVQGAGRLIIWRDSTTTPSDWIYPKMSYKGNTVDGYLPGKYTVRLIVRNLTTGCTDSTAITGIEVSPSKFNTEAIPNAFTPNGDGQNDIFKFVKGNEPVSLENIKIAIYSRSGMLVYKYEGHADEWEGWDGRLMGNRGQVADGVYFYIFSGEGWDGVQYSSSDYKGALHIFR